MVATILAFCTRLLPHLRVEGAVFFHDDIHRVTVEELPNGNARFSAATRLAGEWFPMGSIEVEAGRYFWTRVVEALRCYTGATFSMPDPLVASVAQGLPGADLLTQERARETVALPRAKPRAGARLPGFEGTIKSTKKTKVRGKPDDEDILGN
jgi:hypothetical protein